MPSPRPDPANPTLRDVAGLAGVSTATVSNALTGTRPVSARSREAVLAAAAELGYRGNVKARALRTGRTSAIALVVPDVTNPFFAEFADEVEDAARELGWSITLANTRFDVEREHEYLEDLDQTSDGLLLLSTSPHRSTAGDLAAAGFPVVTCDEPFDVPGAGAVRSDNAGGARLAAHHLVDRGARRIGVIAGPQRLPSSAVRVDGFVAGLTERGIELVDDDHIVRDDYGMDGGRSAMWQLLTRDPDLDAVFACTDMQAIGAVFGAMQAGRSVPDDLLVCGFDGIDWTAQMRPTLTTVSQDRRAMARTAVQMLVDMIRGGEPRTVVLPTDLLIRESTSPPGT